MSKNAQGFVENKKAALISGKIAGNARKELENESGENIISNKNYLPDNNQSKIIDE